MPQSQKQRIADRNALKAAIRAERSLIAQAATTQNVGRPPPRPWGSAPPRGRTAPSGNSSRAKTSRGKDKNSSFRAAIACLDATNPRHLPLPRAVGDYQVIRTTQVVDLQNIATSASIPIPQFVFFAPLVSQPHGTTSDLRWISACGIASAGDTVSASSGAYLIPMAGLDQLELATTACPAALTVQVMNTASLQEAKGISYIGRSSAQYDLAGSVRSWTQLGSEFVQYMTPRLCAGGKLSLRGVKTSAYPLDMNELSDFRPLRPYLDIGTTHGKFTWSADVIKPEGFSPIVIYNPSSMPLQILVTIEWRVRFDPGNPAAASHRYHGVASDSLWGKVTSTMSAMGHGVVDMAEEGLEVGAIAAGAARLAPLMA